MYCYKCRPDRTWNIMMSLCCLPDRKKEKKIERRTNGIHLYTYMHTDIHTTTCIHCGYLFFFLCDCCRLCKSMLIVCMYGCVSDRRGPRLSTWLLLMGIFGRWRSSWTIPRTRRPRSRYEEAVTATYRWNHLRPNLLYSVLHSYIRTYIHTLLFPMFDNIWRRRCILSFSPIHTSTYVVFYTHVHAYSVCMYVCV